MKITVCTACGKQVPADAFCRRCGSRYVPRIEELSEFELMGVPIYGPPMSYKHVCPKCKHITIEDILGATDGCYCPKCGTAMDCESHRFDF